MILDKRTEFCDGVSVALTAGASWQNIGDVIDLGAQARDVGNGQPLYLVISTAVGINAAGAGSLAFRLVSDTDANPPSVTTSTVHAVSPTFTTSTTSGGAGGALAAGRLLMVVALPWEGLAYERYLGIQALVSTQNTTAGSIDAFLTHDPQVWKAYDAPFSA